MSRALCCENLVFSYGLYPDLSIDRLEVETGVVCAIQGPNGAGKSTLLWLLAGLRTARQGTISLFGQELTSRRRDLLRHVTLVMEQPYLLRTTVRRNVEYGLARRGVARPERLRRVSQALQQVGLERWAGHRSWELSQGEKKRLALARALAIQSDILLLDEPTSNIDRSSAALIEQTIEDLRGRTTVLMCTHDISQARRLADEVFTLVEGRLMDVSHENFMEVDTVLRNGRRFAVLFPELEIPVEPGPQGAIHILVDPDEIQLSCSANGTLSLQVSDLSMERRSVRIQMNGSLNLVARMTRERFERLGFTVGQRIGADIPPHAVRVLGSFRNGPSPSPRGV